MQFTVVAESITWIMFCYHGDIALHKTIMVNEKFTIFKSCCLMG